MHNSNPIAYSDLISSDDSIKNLIKQLTDLIAKYEELKSKISASAGDLTKNLNSLSGATEAQREEIAGMAAQTEKLAEEYSKVNNEQKKAAAEVKKLTQAEKEKLKIDKLVKQAAEANEGSFNKLSAQYRLNKIRLNEMSAADREATEAGRQLVKETRAIYEEMSRLQKETGKYTLEVGHYENALRSLPGPMGALVNHFTQLRTTISGIANSDLPKAQKAMMVFGATAAGVVTSFVVLAKSIATVIKTNAQFEQSIVNLSTIVGRSREELEDLRQSALTLGRTTEYTASQVVELQTALAKLGFKDAAIIGMQKSVLQFATAVGANLEDAAQVAGSTLRSFNLTSADTEETLGALAVACNNSALSFYRIRESMGTVFPIANAFDLSVKDAAAMLGTLANAGYDASMAATAVRNILGHITRENGKLSKSLSKPVEGFEGVIDAMIELRKQGYKVAELIAAADKRSAGPIFAMMNAAERARELRASLEDVDGELERIQKERLNTVEGQTRLLKSAWESLELAFSESNGTIKETVHWLTELVRAVQMMLFPQQTFIAESIDKYTEQFQDYYAQYGATAAEAFMQRFLNTYEKMAEEESKKAGRDPFFNRLLGIGKNQSASFAATNSLTAIRRAARIVNQQIQNDEEEAKRRRELEDEDRKRRAKELSEAEKRRIAELNKQRLADIKAEIEAVNLKIAVTEKGTDDMLKYRKEKINLERKYELEQNRQKVESEKQDEEAINAKYDKKLIDTKKEFNKELAQLAAQRLQIEQQTLQAQITNVEKNTEQELALRLKANEVAMQLELEQNKQKDEKLRQSESAIKTKYYRQAMRLEADFNTKLAKRDLAATQELAAKEFELLDRNERQKTIFKLEQEQARLEALLKINEKASEKMTDAEVEAMQATINALKAERKRLGYDNIYELLGIKLDSDQQSAIKTALDSVKDSIDSLIDSWKEAADAARETADAQVEAAQKMLDAEIEARQQGYASREEYARKELNLAKQTQEAAIREQKKAQEAAELLDAATQASSLVTASANIWKALSGIEVVGPALAIAAITAMWGSFAAAKIKAAEVTGTTKYAEGTVELLQGGSHASGHDIDLGRKSDGTRRKAEGGEYFAIINKRNSAKYGSLIPEVINSLNNGTFAERFARAGDEMAGAVLAMGHGTDVSRLERDVRAIREQGVDGRTIEGGWTIIRHKNLTRKIKS